MPQNRLERDEILQEGLDLADLPGLDRHDRPAGAIDPDAYCIQWLQRCIDLMIQEFPFAGHLTTATGSIASGALNSTDFAPADFILDVRNGLTIRSGGSSGPTVRLERQAHQWIIGRQTQHDNGGSPTTGRPQAYAFSRRDLRLDITTDQAYTYTLWYYALPSVLASGTTPNFPSDWVMVEFVRLRALEWAQKIDPGSAVKYLREVEIPALRAAGLDQEPEDNYIPLDYNQFRRYNFASGENRWPYPPRL